MKRRDPGAQDRTPVSISVAMATYNGEAFLEEQLRSIAQQTFLPLELVVRDDGSSDRTLSILTAFAAEAPFSVRILPSGSRLGYADNFLTVAAACEGQYVAFSDQDDVWMPQKLEVIAAAIARAENPTVVMHSAKDVDEHLLPTTEQANRHRPRHSVRLHADPLLVVRGFLLTVRRDVFLLMANTARPRSPGSYTEFVAHDVWAYHCGNMLGPIVILADELALYRRHSGNVTTLRPKSRSQGPLDRTRRVDLDYLARYVRFCSEIAERVPDAAARRAYGVYAVVLKARMALYEPGTSLAQRISRLQALVVARAGNRFGEILPLRTLAKDVLFTLLGPERRSGPALRGPKQLPALGEKDKRQRG